MVVILAVALTLVLDSLLRQLQRPKLKLDFEPTHTAQHQRALIVYFPGILAGARTSSEGFSDIWLRHGDVLFVEYSGQRFKANDVVSRVVEFINRHDYQRIVLIGSSMGGLLSNDVVLRLDHSRQAKITMVALDAPTSASDFQSPLDTTSRLTRLLPFGPIWNPASRLIMKFLVLPPKEQNIEKGVDRAQLARSVKRARSYRLSFWRDQIMYMISHPKLRVGSLGHIKRFVYVRSLRDTDTVRPEAYDAWRRARHDIGLVEVDSTHVGFAERPKTWRRAFQRIFAILQE